MKFALLLCALLPTALADAHENQAAADKVSSLPGQRFHTGFEHYSGYLSASPTHKLHYWFVTSQHSPANDPLIIWMNGGPGCSSMDGAMNELGPFQVQPDGASVALNPFSWNKMANIIFLEAPAGVGFSYATDGNVTTGDDQTSAENYEALKQWFKRFPAFRNHAFFIGGESYGGIYVPTLAKRFIDGNHTFPVNLQGIYIGNGFLSPDLNTDTMVEYGYTHGIMSEHDWDFAERTCCHGCSDFCPFHKAQGGVCERIVTDLVTRMWTGGLNPYDMYRDCAYPASSFDRHSKHRVLASRLVPQQSREAIMAHFDRLAAQNSRNDGGQPNCMNDTAIEMYLNRHDVQAALHVQGHVRQWRMCSSDVEEHYARTTYKSMEPQIRAALARNVRVLVYNGDTDMACNFLLGQRFVQELELELELQKKSWYHGKQVAGFWTKYKGLDFLTVKGAGHMVPQWRPAQAFHMMYRYLNNKPY